MSNLTMNYTGTLIIEDCCTCGIPFGMPSDYRQKRLNDHKIFYCPAGHGQHYAGKSDAEKAAEEAARLRNILKTERTSSQAARDQLRAANRSNAALRGVNTRTKNRIANGICPCCRRTFKDLARHMEGQHPDYAEGTGA